MERTERIILWTLVGLTCVGLIVLTVITVGELAEIDRQLLALAGDEGSVAENRLQRDLATAVPGGGQTTQVAIAHVEVLTDSITMTVTVRAYGAGDLLFEPPLLRSAEGQIYPATGDSLEQARIAFLDLVTRGETSAHLEFAGRLIPTSGLWLVFNPNQESTSVVAPPLEAPVPPFDRLRTGLRTGN